MTQKHRQTHRKPQEAEKHLRLFAFPASMLCDRPFKRNPFILRGLSIPVKTAR